jgi:hypothetical protein
MRLRGGSRKLVQYSTCSVSIILSNSSVYMHITYTTFVHSCDQYYFCDMFRPFRSFSGYFTILSEMSLLFYLIISRPCMKIKVEFNIKFAVNMSLDLLQS